MFKRMPLKRVSGAVQRLENAKIKAECRVGIAKLGNGA